MVKRLSIHSLRIKIAAITIAAILASLAAFALAGFFTVGQEASDNSAEKMFLISENARLALDDYLETIQQSVEMTSHIASNSLDSMILIENGANRPPEQRTAEQTAALDAYLTENCAFVQDAFDSVASHTDGIVTYYYCIDPRISVQEHGFFYSKMGKVGFERREPLDARELDPNDLEHTTWYYTPIERGTPSWVGPYKAHFLDEVLTVSYLTPIYKSGILIGVMGMDILFDTMADHIGSLDIYRTGFACLLDGEGRVLYHPELELGAVPTFSEQVVCKGSAHKANSGNEVIRYDQNGQTWQLSFSTLSNGMKLVVTAPVSEVVASWRHLIQSIPIIALVILGLFVPASMLAMRAVIMPLNQLTTAAHRLSSGDYDVELDYHSNDEVGELTDAFRRLRDHLQVYISDVNSQAYVDTLTNVKNKNAYGIYAAQLDDKITRSQGQDDLQFALVAFDCANVGRINDEYGRDKGDLYLKAACKLICQVYARSPVFRMSGDEFVVLLQGRDFANRDELFHDFDIMKDMSNARAQDPWDQINVAKGMATFRAGEDERIAAVMHRAHGRMNEDKTR